MGISVPILPLTQAVNIYLDTQCLKITCYSSDYICRVRIPMREIHGAPILFKHTPDNKFSALKAGGHGYLTQEAGRVDHQA